MSPKPYPSREAGIYKPQNSAGMKRQAISALLAQGHSEIYLAAQVVHLKLVGFRV